jgi:hypothetical protein
LGQILRSERSIAKSAWRLSPDVPRGGLPMAPPNVDFPTTPDWPVEPPTIANANRRGLLRPGFGWSGSGKGMFAVGQKNGRFSSILWRGFRYTSLIGRLAT